MASFEEMCEVSPEPKTKAELEAEMKQCESVAETGDWETSVDEVLTKPDVNRTTFLWQIEAEPDSDVEDEFEKADSQWRCLPATWQTLLNSRLADHQGRLQDAEALWKHRLEMHGMQDIKTKNAHAKYKELSEGKGTCSVILISKVTGKEVAADCYRKCVQNQKGELKVTVSPRVTAYKFSVSSMTLQTLGDPMIERHVRIVSVTGRSRDIQEIRLHLSYLSLQSSQLLKELKVSNPAAAAGTEENQEENGEKQCQENSEEVDQVLAVMGEDQVDCEAAEDALVANYADTNFANPGMEEDRYRDIVGCMYPRCSKQIPGSLMFPNANVRISGLEIGLWARGKAEYRCS